MLLSIVIPAYKTEDYLEECLDSILISDRYDLEVLVVDDGSPDSCTAIVNRYMESDSRVRLYHQSNSGPSVARNNGLHTVEGEYVYFMDSDDKLTSGGLEAILNEIVGSSPDIVFFEYELIDDSGRFICHDPLASLFPMADHPIDAKTVLGLLAENKLRDYPWRYVARRSLYMNNSVEFPEDCYFEDLATTYRLVMHANTIRFSSKSILQYRQRVGSTIHGSAATRFKSFEDANRLVTKRAADIASLYPELEKVSKRGELCFFLWASFDLHRELQKDSYKEYGPLLSFVDSLMQERVKKGWKYMKFRDLVKFLLIKTGILDLV